MFSLPEPRDDGLIVRPVGPWSQDKHYFLRRYIDAFTVAMRNKPWSGLHYIDLFCGPGIEFVKEKGLDWGSPLIAAQSPIPFARLHLCDINRKYHDTLAKRLHNFKQPQSPQLICGDTNQIVEQVITTIPNKSLSIAFLDPTGLHLQFKTLRSLSTRRVDFIIFFPDHLDALRNWRKVYAGKPDSNLDLVLGGAPWRGQLENAPREKWAQVLRDLYVNQIRGLGYEHFAFERISMPNGRLLYQLIFCSRDNTGLKIWNGISRSKPGGQQSLDFES
jgi:three-Cys-motif partner protein